MKTMFGGGWSGAPGRSTGRPTPVVPGRLLCMLIAGATLAAAGCGGGAAAHHDPAVAAARAAVERVPPLSAYRGPADGAPAQPPTAIVFVAANLLDGGIAAVARGAEEAAGAIGWRLQVLDGESTVEGEQAALRAALRRHPGGIILGGIDAQSQRSTLLSARAAGVPVVGWHAGGTPGAEPALGLDGDVMSPPVALGRLAADYVISDSGGHAGSAILTDPRSAFCAQVAGAAATELRRCTRCSLLAFSQTPSATAAVDAPALVSAFLQEYGPRLGYIEGAASALLSAGRRGDEPPYGVAAGAGEEAEFARIRADQYQRASVAEPLNLEGWQLIDELNRGRAGRPPSSYSPPPRLITSADVPSGGGFDPASGYRQNYRRIWGR